MSERRATTVRGGLSRDPVPILASLGVAAALGFGASILVADRKRRASGASVATAGALATAGIAGAFGVLTAVLDHDRVVLIDRHLHNYFRQRRSAAQKRAVKATTIVGSPFATAPVGLAGALLAFRRGDVRAAAAILLAIAGSASLAKALKGIVQRERPAEGAIDKDEYSFPSGHTLMTASVYALLAYILVADEDLGPARFAAAGTLVSLIPWTAFSRIYLGQHWASDTVASVALATAWDAVLITFLRADK